LDITNYLKFLNPVYEKPYSDPTTHENLMNCKKNNNKWVLIGGYHTDSKNNLKLCNFQFIKIKIINLFLKILYY